MKSKVFFSKATKTLCIESTKGPASIFVSKEKFYKYFWVRTHDASKILSNFRLFLNSPETVSTNEHQVERTIRFDCFPVAEKITIEVF